MYITGGEGRQKTYQIQSNSWTWALCLDAHGGPSCNDNLRMCDVFGPTTLTVHVSEHLVNHSFTVQHQRKWDGDKQRSNSSSLKQQLLQKRQWLQTGCLPLTTQLGQSVRQVSGCFWTSSTLGWTTRMMLAHLQPVCQLSLVHICLAAALNLVLFQTVVSFWIWENIAVVGCFDKG